MIGLIVLSSCGGVKEVADGEGALQSAPHLGTLGKVKHQSEPGDVWSTEAAPFCLTPGAAPVELVSIDPVEISGAVSVDTIGVLDLDLAAGEVGPGLAAGVWPGLVDVADFEVDVVCGDSDRALSVVVALKKESDEGGRLNGLNITYADEVGTYTYEFGLHFELCGTGEDVVECDAQSSG